MSKTNAEIHAEHVKQGKHPASAKRSSRWPSARRAHLQKHPRCYVCLSTKKVEVHHVRPFHLHPELELDPRNFITLCEKNGASGSCHLLFGHLSNFKSVNVDVFEDARIWRQKLLTRPK